MPVRFKTRSAWRFAAVALLALLPALTGCKDEDTDLPFVFLDPVVSPVRGDTTLRFELVAPSGTALDASVVYTEDFGQTFQPATPAAGSPGLTQLAASPTGVEHTFVWDPLADLGPGLHRDVILRVFTPGNGSAPADTTTLIVDLTDRLQTLSATEPTVAALAVPLPDGSVWIAGGRRGSGALVLDAYRYLPETTAFAPVSGLSVARAEVGGALLSGGQALAAGGRGTGGPVDAAELFRVLPDGTTPRSVIVGGLQVARARAAVAALPGGGAVVVGGDTSAGTTPAPAGSIERFTPSAAGDDGTFVVTATDPLAARVAATATSLADGRVLVTGGADASGDALVLSAFVAADGATLTAGPSARPRAEHGAVLLPDGRVVVVGGTDRLGDDARALNTVEVFDPTSNSFAFLPSMRLARRNPGVAYTDGAIVVFGGTGAPDSPTTAERLELGSGAWVDIAGPSAAGRDEALAVTVGPGQVLLVGGDAEPELYTPAADLVAGTFDALTEAIPAARADHTATDLFDGTVLIVGGTAQVASALATVERFDPRASRDTFSVQASLGRARARHAAVRVADGRVLVVGGVDATGPVATAELFDPAANTWIDAGTLGTPRADATATLLPDSRVLIAGGVDASGTPLASLEVWDPSTRAFTSAGSLSTARTDHRALIVSGGRVAIGPGLGASGPLADLEVLSWPGLQPDVLALGAERAGAGLNFDPFFNLLTVSGGTTTTGVRQDVDLVDLRSATPVLVAGQPPLQLGRTRHDAVRLRDARALLVGGRRANGLPLDEGEVLTYTVTPTVLTASSALTRDERMTKARQRHTSTLLIDGRVLVVGGVDERGVTIPGAELFRP